MRDEDFTALWKLVCLVLAQEELDKSQFEGDTRQQRGLSKKAKDQFCEWLGGISQKQDILSHV